MKSTLYVAQLKTVIELHKCQNPSLIFRILISEEGGGGREGEDVLLAYTIFLKADRHTNHKNKEFVTIFQFFKKKIFFL